MQPRTISASALKVAESCMARYKAEYIDGARGLSTSAADLGTTCHLALQMYVEHAVIEGSKPQTIETLMDYYTAAYLQVMRAWDYEAPLFKEGANMMHVWHARNDFTQFKVISCEVKEFFEVPYKIIDPARHPQFNAAPPNEFGFGASMEPVTRKMRLNYIADRVDDLGHGRIRVVDYKSWRGLVDSHDVREMLQARIYALAYQIKYPSAPEIWVSIDQLRGEEVGSVFTKADNAATWRWLKKALQEIIDTPADRVRETLNDECGYCIRKTVCKELRKHDLAGGVLDMTLDNLAKLKYELMAVAKAVKYALEDVDAKIAKDLDEFDMRELDTISFGDEEVYHISSYGNSREEVDQLRFPEIVGDDVALEIATFPIGKVRGLKGDPRVKGKWKEVEGLITTRRGKRTVKVTKKKGAS